MEVRQNLKGLDWLVEQIEVSLQHASELLEAYLSEPEDESQIRFCLDHLHQVHGALVLAGCNGPLILSEEMELLAGQIHSREVSSIDEAGEVLVQAILWLPAYIRDVIASGKDKPEALLLLLNELRSVRRRPLVSEGPLFAPMLNQPPISGAGALPMPRDEALKNLLRKLRQMYQFAVLGVIKNGKLDENLGYLSKVFLRLQELSQGTEQSALWLVANAFLENLKDRNIAVGAAVKMLLRSLDSQLKQLLELGLPAFRKKPEEALIKNLLFYVAHGHSDGAYSAQVREKYQLDRAMPEGVLADSQKAAFLFQPEVAENIVSELSAELNEIKDRIERIVMQGSHEPTQLEEAAQRIERISDSLALVGAASLREKLKSVSAVLGESIEGTREPTTDNFAELATRVVEVEIGLQSWLAGDSDIAAIESDDDSAGAELGRAQQALLHESRNELEAAKEQIVEFIASQWNREHLKKIPPLIENVAGGLDMISLTRARNVLRNCNRYLHEQLISGGFVPDWNSLDALADAITSVEYYLEHIGPRDAGEGDAILAMAEKSVVALGYSEQEPEQASETAEPVQQDVEPAITGLASDLAESHGSEAIAESAGTEGAATEPVEEPVDPEILEVFIDEAAEVLEAMDQYCAAWAENSGDETALEEIRRCFHTLKGSGRMVGADHVGDLCWAIENLLNRVLAKQLEESAVIPELIAAARAEIPLMIRQFEQTKNTQKSDQVLSLIDCADALARGEQVMFSPPAEPELKEVETDHSCVDATEDTVEDDAAESIRFAPAVGEEPAPDVGTGNAGEDGQHRLAAAEGEEDHELLEIFASEARQHIRAVSEYISEQQREAPLYTCPPSETQRALHTLKGSALMAGIETIGQLVVPLEKLVKQLYKFQLPANEEIVQLLADAVSHLNHCLEQIDHRRPVVIPELESFLMRLDELYSGVVAPLAGSDKASPKPESADPSALHQMMIGGMQQLLESESLLHAWREHPDIIDGVQALRDELGQLQAAAESAGSNVLVETAAQLNAVYDRVIAGSLEPTDELIEALKRAHETLLNMVDKIAARQPCGEPDPDLIRLLGELMAQSTTAPQKGEAEELVIEPLDAADIDRDILQTFIEEGDELLEEMDQALSAWSQEPANASLPEQLKRSLHTLKGGARMASLQQLGDMGHAFEDSIDRLMLAGKMPAQEDFSAYEQQQSNLLKLLQVAKDFLATGDTQASAPAPVAEEPIPADTAAPDALHEIARAVQSVKDLEPTRREAAQVQKPRVVQHEMIKVAAKKLEKLINLAGETSIARSRIIQKISEFSAALDEMESTIRRLQDQVRRIGVETDAQITFRQEQLDASKNEGFDPLELDHYSQLQQLSRSLLESVSDITDLKSTLAEKSRGVEALLIEQGRINTDLQESMMQTRLVPFSRMVPRLRRMVRQLSVELNKRVRLRVDYVEGEIDRNVMENVMSPLEHLLRNSLDHGIEPADERSRLGKPEEGVISIGMKREGGDILIRMADDGRGLNLEAIRNKAVSLGLVDEDAHLEDQEVIQFIFQSGLSTAEKISQVSGRGVGMDVVNSQIRQLGGAIETETQAGQGSCFTIRLPFTVSVNRALMVRAGEDIYALPLNSIGGVIRINSAELEHYYRYPDARMEYAGSKYQVRHLGSLLKEGVLPTVNLHQPSVAMILVHSENRLYAVQVDELLESTEVVVKGLGRQFSAVPGLSGATIRGDGTVVVILDLLALLRASVKVLAGVELLGQGQPDRQAGSQNSLQTVLVVDDSVTVRKVTGRLLTREGFHVVTAKDGVDAMRVLQEHTPDVILLDIEMPRMDGFEVATRLHNNPEFREIPVIMITSRTGEKHRQRAMALGVKNYLGKPYQEEVLLQAIDEVMNPVTA